MGQAPVIALHSPGRGRWPHIARERAAIALGALAVASGVLVDGLYDLSQWALLALVLLALLGMTASAVPGGRDRVVRTALAAAWAFATLAAASMLWAESVDAAWREASRAALYAAALTLVTLLARTPERRRGVVVAVAAGLLLVPVYVWFELMAGAGPRAFVDARLSEPLSYPNGLAFAFVAAAVCGAGLAPALRPRLGGLVIALGVLAAALAVLTQSRAVVLAAVAGGAALAVGRGGQQRVLAFAAVAAAALAATPATLAVYENRELVAGAIPAAEDVSRAAWVALAVAAISGAVWILVTTVASSLPAARVRAARLAVLGLLAVAGVGGLLVVSDGRPVDAARSATDRFAGLNQSVTANRFSYSGGYRYDLWRVAIDQFEQAPVLGKGAGNYADTYVRQRRNPSYVRQPHSLPLQVLAELGIAGAALFALFAGAVLAALFRRRSAGGEAALVTAGGLAVAGATTAAFVAHTSVDWLHNLPGLTLPVCALVGVVLAARGAPSEPRTGVDSRKVVVVLLVIAAAGAGIGRLWYAERELQTARGELRAQPQQALRSAARAVALNPESVPARITQSAARAAAGDYAGSRSALVGATELEPNNYVPYALLGDLETRADNTAAADRAYRRAEVLNPGAPSLRAPSP